VTISANARDCNFGAAIRIAANHDDNIRGALNVYGGTVRTPWLVSATIRGLLVGGAANGYGLSYGTVNQYGGYITVPKIAVQHGQINLYGGTMECTDGNNFSIWTNYSDTFLNSNGGTLRIAGDKRDILQADINNGLILAVRSGTPGTPVFDGTWTILQGSGANLKAAWNPQPVNNATNIHYAATNSIQLGWTRGDNAGDVNHDVYFGTDSATVAAATHASPEYKGTVKDPCTLTKTIAGPFTSVTTYYWRIAETNESGVIAAGIVWHFTTHDGKAYNPKPVDNVNAQPLKLPLQLSWTAGDWAASTNGHKIYFTTEAGGGILSNPIFARPTDARYRGQQTGTSYPLTSLLPNWTLVSGTTYYWCVDEVNGTTTWRGPVWSFTPDTYFNIDDFEDSTTTDDVNTNWLSGYTLTYRGNPANATGCNNNPANGYSGRILMRDSSGKYLQYTYNNAGTNPAFSGASFSEAKHAYSTPTSFTGGGVYSPAPRALRVDYRGTATNAANVISQQCGNNDQDLDRMYVAIEDSAGNVAIYLNPDPNAQLATSWTSWYTALTDINNLAHGIGTDGNPHTVNLEAITGFSIGFGVRGDTIDTDGCDINSVVMFDNIRLYAATCIPSYAQAHGLTADLDSDCDVDINDLDNFASSWLDSAQDLTYTGITAPTYPPVLWYKFNDSNLVTDSGRTGTYTGTLGGSTPSLYWDVNGGRDGNGCYYTPSSGGGAILAPVAALSFINDANHNGGDGGGVTFSMWLNMNVTTPSDWGGPFEIKRASDNGASVRVFTTPWGNPFPTGPQIHFSHVSPGTAVTVTTSQRKFSDFGGRWNHWAFVKSPTNMTIYCNGQLYGDVNSTTNPAVYGPLFDSTLYQFVIGGRYYIGSQYYGRMDDFKVYDYALNANQVAYLATDGTGSVFLPMTSPGNLKSSGNPHTEKIDFGDLAIMCSQWRTIQLWP
jgi:hypothetical protein